MGYNIICIAGVFFLVVSLLSLRSRIHTIKTQESTTATVIRIDCEKDNEGDNTYRAIFRYTTRNNQELIYTQTSSTNPAAWEVGEQVRIVYDPENPIDAIMLSFFEAFGMIVILLIVSLAMLVVGGGHYFANKLFESISN
ncbi:DUF3592 domain-containing protein [Hymenobacter profundi]|uniref:DUF3592 domain-containing protein n=1 Tax=Hymenobacter profundi TaxID=1982110 RepID=UPI003CCEBCA2